MTRRSAGLLLFRRTSAGLEVLLVHPGGPFWAKKEEGAWSIPKGELEPDDDDRTTALRELAEELGPSAPTADPAALIELGSIRQKAGKEVVAWALEADFDCAALASNTFEMEWPPRSGRRQSFPEVDRAEWLDLETAARKINAAQAELLARLAERVGDDPPGR